MRKTMLGLLLAAGVTVPAMASAEGMTFQDRPDAPHQQGDRPREEGQGGGQGGWHHDGGGRPQQAPGSGGYRPQGGEQAAPASGGYRPQPDQPGFRGGPQVAPGSGGYRAQPGQPGYQGGPGFAPGSGGYRPQQGQPGYRGGPQVAPGSGGYRPQPGQPGYQGGPSFAPGSGGYRPQPGQPGYRGGQSFAPGSGGYRGQPAYGGGYRPGQGGGTWNRTWRDDRHYDWRSYRVENRYIFNQPRYYAPAGWGYGYRRFSVGFTLSAVLYAQNYWINDPFYYRLPPAEGPYRWVRYYNDALLIDLRTGYVVDTVYDIFW